MLFKPRTKPDALILLDYLHPRILLDKETKRYHFNLKKGYEGEVIFDSFTENLQCNNLILNDLLLNVNSTTFQIDSLIITQDKIHLFEIKNFQGNYYIDSEKMFKYPKREITNPILQLKRSESLFRQLLRNFGNHLTLEASVVFIHPEFVLYQAPMDQPIVFQNQLKQFMKSIDNDTSTLTNHHYNIANQLCSAHLSTSPYERKFNYHYDQLQKGIPCKKCSSFSLVFSRVYGTCQKCGFKESAKDSVIRNVLEFTALFPNEKITTSIIHDWCKEIPSRKTIRRVLKENYKTTGVRHSTHYE